MVHSAIRHLPKSRKDIMLNYNNFLAGKLLMGQKIYAQSVGANE